MKELELWINPPGIRPQSDTFKTEAACLPPPVCFLLFWPIRLLVCLYPHRPASSPWETSFFCHQPLEQCQPSPLRLVFCPPNLAGILCSHFRVFHKTDEPQSPLGPANTGDTKDVGLIPGSGRSPGVGKWQPAPVLSPGESHGKKGLAAYSP